MLIEKGIWYYLWATLLTALLMMIYIWGDPAVEAMDFWGWFYFLTSCIGHAAVLMLPLWLVFFLPWALLKYKRPAIGLLVGSTALLAMLLFINMQVYKIYRFHINGFIINMLTGPNAGDIFDFDTKLIITETIILLLVAAVAVAIWPLSAYSYRRLKRRWLKWGIGLTAGCLVAANVCHIYGSFVVKPSIMISTRIIPYYFPISASSLLQDIGFERNVIEVGGGANGSGELNYPLRPLQTDSVGQRPNIVLILIDSWSRRSLTEECMPQMWQLAHEEQWYQNHVSCSNGTRYAVFGLFTGLQPYYFTAFESSRTSPVLVDQLLQAGYDFRTYPSASLENPPFHRILFQHVPHLRVNTEGSSAYERDLRIKDDFIADLPALAQAGKPFFSFIFFDLLHAYSLPKNLLNRFQPSWEYGDFTRLNNDMDPTPFWNLYRNSAYQTDGMVSEVVNALKAQGLYDNTLVIITGDHSQEYNENHKNYWGHNSNFSQYQIGVPLIVHQPDTISRPQVFTHRTTHYDFVPTLMHDYLGVQNPVDDYSAGRLLSDVTPRLWHFVGNELRYAFLVEGDTILTKEGAGYIEVTDARLNIVDDYHIKPREFDKTIKDLNRFFKQ